MSLKLFKKKLVILLVALALIVIGLILYIKSMSPVSKNELPCETGIGPTKKLAPPEACI